MTTRISMKHLIGHDSLCELFTDDNRVPILRNPQKKFTIHMPQTTGNFGTMSSVYSRQLYQLKINLAPTILKVKVVVNLRSWVYHEVVYVQNHAHDCHDRVIWRYACMIHARILVSFSVQKFSNKLYFFDV